MKRVAYICADPGVPVFGRKGASVHVQEVIRAFGRQGVRVELFASRMDGITPPGLEKIPVHQLPSPPKGELVERERAALAANDALSAALQAAGSFDLVYERYSLWSFAGMEFARDQGWPGVLEVNAPLIEEQAAHRGLADRPAAETVARRAFDAASLIVCVSDEVAVSVRALGADPAKVHVVPNGVSPERFTKPPPPALPPAPGTFVIGFVGTLKPWHGLPVLAEAFAELHRCDASARLLIVGDGPGRAELEKGFLSRGLNHSVHFTGAVSPEEIPGWLASMHVGVAPYPPLTNFYFSPLKVFEYMAAGLPVVASRIGQLERFIEHGANGLLTPPGNTGALASALAQLRDDPELRYRLGQAARVTVFHNQTWDCVVQRILKIGMPALSE